MSDQKVIRTVVISDPSGVHLRTASAIEAITRRSQSQVQVVSAYHRAKGTDIWDLLALAAPCGSSLTLEVTGPDAQQVLDALEPLFTGDETALSTVLKPANETKKEDE